MASNRNPLTCGAEISFCGDRILVIAQVVADVGQRLDQGDTEIGNMRFLPVRSQKSESQVRDIGDPVRCAWVTRQKRAWAGGRPAKP